MPAYLAVALCAAAATRRAALPRAQRRAAAALRIMRCRCDIARGSENDNVGVSGALMGGMPASAAWQASAAIWRHHINDEKGGNQRSIGSRGANSSSDSTKHNIAS